MSVYRKKGRKTWMIRLYIRGKGVRDFSSKTTDKLRAQQIDLQLRLGQARRAEHQRVVEFVESITSDRINALDRGMPLELAWDAYCELPEFRLSPEQVRKKHDAWRRFLSWLGDSHPRIKHMPEVERDHCYEWVRSLMDGSIRGKSVNNLRGCVSSVFQALMHKAKLKENPFSVVKQAPTDDSDRGRALTDDEVSRLLKTAKEPWYGAILVAIYTGLRFTDVAHLEWESVRDGVIVVTPSKTRRRNVQVTIPIHPALAAYFSSRERGNDICVFPYLVRWYEEVQRDAVFGKLLARSGIRAQPGEYVGFHSLRHTFITRLSSAGVPQDVRMKLAGHSQASTHSMYDHDLQQAADAIAKLPAS